MITIAKNDKITYTNEQINAKFLELMPTIIKIAKHAFKNYDADRKEDAVQSVLVTAFQNIIQEIADYQRQET